MFIPDPDFCPSRSRVQKQQQKRGVGKKLVLPFCGHKYHKIENCLNFELVKKKIWANLQRISELSTQKIVTKLSTNMGLGSGIRDPGSGKKTYPGVKKAPDPDPQHFFEAADPIACSYLLIRDIQSNILIAVPRLCSGLWRPTCAPST
jgi:hypothetical protein